MVQSILGASVVQEKYKSAYDLTSGANHALAADRKKPHPLKSGEPRSKNKFRRNWCNFWEVKSREMGSSLLLNGVKSTIDPC